MVTDPFTSPPDADAAARPPKRAPQQRRGERRVDEILDAAAALVAEGGSAAATVQAIGQRAGASKGSMYHFFRDRESVLLALVDRHVEHLAAVLAASRVDSSTDGSLAPEAAADLFLDPIHAYVLAHPDLSLMMAEPTAATQLGRQRDALLGLVEEHAAWVVRRAAPALAGASVSRAAGTLGALASLARNPRVVAAAGSPEAARAEARRIVAEYLRWCASPREE